MLTSQRKRLILDKLRAEGQVVAKSISHELDLSEDTIRRDLRELAQEGLLQRVHGGALPVSPAVANFCRAPTFWNRRKECDWPNCCPDDSIRPGCHPGWRYYGSSRSAPFITQLRATIVTHSPTIAVELVRHPNVEVVILGGRLFKHSVVAVGAALVEAASRIRADTYFMGVTGVHAEAGLSTGDLEEADVKRA
jgi:Transcriptional regulators of sugar metabolism